MEIKDIAVARLMSSDLVTVTPETPVEEAGEILLERGIGSLVVVDSDDRLAGILTSTDFVELVTGGASTAEATVADHMSTDVVTVGVDDSIRDAAAKMVSTDIQHLPVEDDDGGIAGMLSTTDLTAHLAYLEA
jgi:CBS domain-containing protein